MDKQTSDMIDNLSEEQVKLLTTLRGPLMFIVLFVRVVFRTSFVAAALFLVAYAFTLPMYLAGGLTAIYALFVFFKEYVNASEGYAEMLEAVRRRRGE